MSSGEFPAQICLFDDDVYPKGRATKVLNCLSRSGYKAILIKSFSGLKMAFAVRSVDTQSTLFVMDSTIQTEGERTATFSDTLPWIIGMGVRPEMLIPASGGLSGYDNNEYFRAWLEYTERYIMTPDQMALSITGLGGNPEGVASEISRYYESLNLGIGEGLGPGTLR